MMNSYIGRNAPDANRERVVFEFVAQSTGANVLQGTDDLGQLLAYTPGQINVSVAGLTLGQSQYVGTDGSKVTVSATAGQLVRIESFGATQAVTQLQGSAATINVTGSASFAVNTGSVGIGTSSPQEKLHLVEGATDARIGYQSGSSVITLANSEATGDGGSSVRVSAGAVSGSLQSVKASDAGATFGRPRAGHLVAVQDAGLGMMVGTRSNAPLIIGTNDIARIVVEEDGDILVLSGMTMLGTLRVAGTDTNPNAVVTQQRLNKATRMGPRAFFFSGD